MNWVLVLTWLAVLVLFLLGLAGIVLPGLPGVILIFAGTLLYAVVDRFQSVTGWTILGFALLTGVATGADYLAGIVGARRYGASRMGLVGAALGLLVGLFFSIPGMILGPLVGAMVFEMIGGRGGREALRAGWGTFLGFLGGVALKLAIGVTMIGIFFYRVI